MELADGVFAPVLLGIGLGSGANAGTRVDNACIAGTESDSAVATAAAIGAHQAQQQRVAIGRRMIEASA